MPIPSDALLIQRVKEAADAERAATDAVRAAVFRARRYCISWNNIGEALGTTRQAATQRFQKLVEGEAL